MNHVEKTRKVYEELGKRYIDSIAPARWMEFDDFTSKVKKGKVLDLGCAGGRDSNLLSKAGFEVIGIDLVDSFLKQARHLVPKAKFIKMDFRKLEFNENEFDGIWASMALVHLKQEEAEGVIKSFSNILNNNGYIFIGLKEGKGQQYVPDPLTGDLKRFFKYYKKGEFDKILEKNNFEIISSRVTSDVLGRDQKIITIIARNKK
jgi:SAM-dependent methyltransferase